MALQLEYEHFPLPGPLPLEVLDHADALDQAGACAVGGADRLLEGCSGDRVHSSYYRQWQRVIERHFLGGPGR